LDRGIPKNISKITGRANKVMRSNIARQMYGDNTFKLGLRLGRRSMNSWPYFDSLFFCPMNSAPLVSIITVTFNNADYLEQCIQSVLAQSLSDWEWLIINNGSNDGTAEILNELSDERIVLVNLNENLGVSVGRNEGLKRMTGKLFTFLDGDDVLPLESLRSRAKILQEDDQIGAVDGSTLTFHQDLSNVIARYKPSFHGIPLVPLLSLDGTCFFGNTWMLRKKDVEYAFRPGLSHGEELLFYAEYAGDVKYSYTSETVLFYRKHGESAMNNLNGLIAGYIKVGKELEVLEGISDSNIKSYKTAARRIMFRSFLKNFQLLEALKAWIKLAP